MTPRVNNNVASEAVEVLISNGMEGLAGAVEILLNTAMRIERSCYLGAGPYERSEERVSQGNGFKPKQLDSRLGSLQLQIPQTRDCQFYPRALECAFSQ